LVSTAAFPQIGLSRQESTACHGSEIFDDSGDSASGELSAGAAVKHAVVFSIKS